MIVSDGASRMSSVSGLKERPQSAREALYAAVHPGVLEVEGNGVDDDCDALWSDSR